MVRELAFGIGAAGRYGVREAIRAVMKVVLDTRSVTIVLPDDATEERLSEILVRAILDLGIGVPAPQA